MTHANIKDIDKYTGVDPKQEFCELGDHWGITGNFEGGKAHLATSPIGSIGIPWDL